MISVESQFTIVMPNPRTEISRPRYEGWRTYLYSPVRISLWSRRILTSTVKNLRSCKMAAQRMITPIRISSKPKALML